MTATELLSQLRAINVKLSVIDEDLVVRGKQELLSPALLSHLREHKHDLLDLLRDPPKHLPLVELSPEEIDKIVATVPGRAANVQDIYPLAPLQEGILFHHLMGGEGDPYLSARQLSFESRAQLDAFLRAMQWVVDRHDILRTAVLWEGLREPVQVVWRHAQLQVEELELDPAAGDIAEQLYSRFDPRKYRIDVRHAPLQRFYIAQDRENGRWLLLQHLHHLVGDRSTGEIMLGEVGAYLQGRQDMLPAPLPFRNLVAQARLGVSQEGHEVFFRQLLGDVDEATVPFGLKDVRGDGSGIEEAHLRLESALARRLRGSARRLGVSVASLCHLAWARVLAKVSGREDVVFGTVLFGRMQGGAGSDRAMGLFINTLPVRILVGDEGVEAAVRQTHALLAELMRHEHAPLALAQRCSAVPAPAPLFSALLNYRHTSGGAAAQTPSSGIRKALEGMQIVRRAERTNNYPFTLSINDLGEGLSLDAQTPASIGPLRVCEYMRVALESLTEALEASPSRPVRTLAVLPERERDQVLYAWNATGTSYPSDRCVHELFEAQVAKTPEAVAVVFEDEQLSYGELNRRANQLAHYLRELGVVPDARVAICVERGFEMVVGLLAVLKAGGAYVPLDPAYPVDRLRFMLEDSGPVALLTQAHLAGLFSDQTEGLPILDLTAEAAAWRNRSDANVDADVTPRHLAYVIYTSGSTGMPKGVLVEHQQLSNYLLWSQQSYYHEMGSGSPAIHSIGFDGLVTTLYGPLLSGQVLALPRKGDEIESILGHDSGSPYTLIKLTPSHLKLLNQRIISTGTTEAPTRALMIGGEALVSSDIVFWQQRFPGVRLINHFGPTEATVGCSTYEITELLGEEHSVPIGRPIANTRIYILDSGGKPSPVGVRGELYIGGAGVARGYLNRAELTSERFVTDPFTEEADGRMYRTGDLGRWLPDGNIEFLGRNDDQVKIRGFRIELGEIESRLLRHTGVREAVVVAREDSAGDKRLVAYYVETLREEGEALNAEQLRGYLSASLPEYMVPSAYVRLESLPLTSNGKLDRKSLPAPDVEAYAVHVYEAPQGEIEEKLAVIWAEVLKVERVGRHDNFFSLGGHSMLAVTLIERMRLSGFEFDVRSLFTATTLAELAAMAGDRTSEVAVPANRIPFDCKAIAPEMLPLIELRQEEINAIVARVPGGTVNVQDIYPLAPLQEGILFHHLTGGEGDPYLSANQFSFDSRTQLDNCLRAMQWVVDRHDILRTAVLWEGLREPVQVVWRHARLQVEELELDPAAGDIAEQLYSRFDPRKYRIDVREAPLQRFYIAQDRENGRWIVVLLRHHLAGDHSTLEVMLGEVGAYLQGRQDMLPAPLPFRNLVAQARLGVSQEEHEVFFRQLLGDVDEATVPFGLLNVRGDGSGIDEAHLELDIALARRLRGSARRLGVSVASLCHLAWARVLAKVSGREDVVFGTVLFGRMQGGAGSDRAMGLFINTLPVRILVGDGGVESAARQTHALLAELMRHEHAPLALAQRCSAVPAPAPLFSALLNYRHNSGAAAKTSTSGIGQILEGIRILRGGERTNYPFALSINDLGEGLSLDAQAPASIGPLRVCEYMRVALESLTEALETSSAKPVRTLDVLPERDREQVLFGWNQTAHDFPVSTVPELFEVQAARTPDAVAVVFGDEQLSYGELNRRANQLAHYLWELGVRPDDGVAICVERGFEMIVGLLAVLKAGGAYVPLDPAYPVDRLCFMLEDSRPVALLTQAHLAGLFSDQTEGLPVLDLTAETAVWRSQPDSNPTPEDTGLRPDHLAYVIYTSGSTGRPKGVMVEHRNIIYYANGVIDRFSISSPLRYAIVTTIATDLGNTAIYPALVSGGSIYIVPQSTIQDSDAFAEYMDRHQIDVLKIGPSHLAALHDDISSHKGLPRRILILGGESSKLEWVQQLRAIAPCTIYNHYGPTETTVGAIAYKLGKELPSTASKTLPLGKPLPNTAVYLLDSAAEPVPIGVIGEIYIAGNGVARGYLNRAELTSERFVPDPFTGEAGARMYRTGDLGRWLPDGNIEFLGRNDFQVKIRGFRIELGEIEAALQDINGIRDAVVISRESTGLNPQLTAYVTVDSKSQALWDYKSVHILPDGYPVAHLNKNETDYIYEEIFLKQAYLRHGITVNDGDCILDVGANIGLFSIFLDRIASNLTIYAFEPNPEVYKRLEANASSLDQNITCFPFGLSDRNAYLDMTFYEGMSLLSGFYTEKAVDHQTILSYALKNPAHQPALLSDLTQTVDYQLRSKRVRTEVRTLSDVIRNLNINRVDLLKINVEKAELDILRGLTEQDWEKIQQLVIEVDLKTNLDGIILLLKRHEYDCAVWQDPLLNNTDLHYVYAVRRHSKNALLHEEPSYHVRTLDPPTKQPLVPAILRLQLVSSLPEYMVPSAYVRLESLPLTSNGKLDRKSLPAPDVEAYAAPVYEAPQGEMEEQLASIWAEVLKVERVGRQDNFFSLGGHSLLAMRVVTRLRQLLHVEVAIREVFAHPVLSDLASALSSASRVELPPIGRAVRSGSLALSFAQQRLWFLAQLEGVSRAYHISGGLRLQGALDKGVLRRALDRIVERHEVLRTSFAFVEEEPVQRIGSVEESRFHLVEHDLGEVGDAERELRGLIAEEASGSFDLERGPLIRGRLVRLGDEDHVLWITMHHIISDGWSMGVLVKELSALYAAFLEGRQDPLPALEIQYADYAVWQRQWMEGEILQRQAEYWQRTLSGAPELLELPLDRPRPFQKDYAGASVPLVLDEELTAGLKALSRRHGTTLYMTLLAGWATLLSKLSGEPDVVIGTPTANRGRAEIEGLVGFFVNTLALRVDLSGSPSVRELLERVKSQALSAQQHQDIPFEQVVELLNPVRSLSHSPLFQVMFVWQNNEQGTAKLPGLELSPLPSSAQRVAKFDLTLSLQEAGERISGGIEYATSLFEAETIERYLGYFRSLLGAMVADEGQSVYRLRMLSERERDQVLYAWNATGTSYPSDRCVHELFEAQVAKTPEAVAVVFEDEQLSYGELNRRANQLAHYLRELGVVPDARVAICVERGFEMVVGLLAVLKAGGAYVPLDPAYPVDRLRFMLEDSGPVALLTQAHLAGLFSDQTEGLPILDLTAEAAAWRNRSDANVDADVTPRHLAYVIYTSGSTGMPKGVLVEHGGVVNRLTWMQQAYDLQPCEAVLQKTPFGFDVSVWEFFWTLIAGARLVMAQPEGHKDPGYLIATTLRNKITTMHFVPSMLQAFLEHPELADIPTLVRVVCSGEALPGALLQRFREKLPHAVLHNLYGPTEAAVDVTAWTCPVNFNQFVVPIGKPIANTRIYILDGGGEPVPVGVSGELYIGGVQVARGYLNRAELTSERFVTDPFTEEADARMYRTGDVGRWLSDGNIEFLGRNDDQVKIRGFRIELGEIESRLLRHAGVREAVVIAREDSAGDKRLVAYYVEALREEGEALNAEQLRGYLSASLPEYMVPSAYVRLESLPLTSNGKLDRKSLPAPDVEAYAAPVYEAPQGEMEEQLASIWAEVLKVERVGRQDNFFSLGGHSLLAVTLIERMRRSGLRVEVRALFATPTLAELAATAGAGVSEVSVPVNGIPLGSEAIDPGMLPLIELRAEEIGRIVARVPGGAANVQDIYPLAPLQEGILFHHLMGGEGDAYLVSVLAAVDTREQLDAFLRAMQWVVDRHDILRTAVLWEGLREPVQVVWRHARLQVEELELDPAAGDIAEQLYSRFDPRKYRIDVREAPLQRFYIAQDRENGRWIVVLLRHHLAGDHSTLEVMLGEVGAYLQGRQDMLPAPLPFRNLVAQARLGVSQEEHEVFFRQLLGDVDEATVPFGLKDVRGDGSGIEEAHLRLESALARRLRGSARRLGVSVASLCHLAWARVLAKVSGREDVVFGTVLFGRMQGGAGSDRAMGLFINTLPVRILVGDEGVEAAVRQTHALLAELMRHEHAPLALAQRCSAVPAPAPLFSALLNYRHTSGGAAAKTATSGTRPAPGGVRILRGAERTNYPFALSINDLGEGLSLDAQTPASIAPLRVCEYMRVALESLTEALEASPSRPVRTLAVLPERERDQVLYAWNATGTSYPSDRCVHELFEAQVAKTPEAVAVVFEDEQLSYGELNRRANQLAHYLRELGVVPDARVAICVERGFEMVVGLLAVLKAGGAYVPLDPAYPVDRLRFMLEDSGPVALLTQAHLAGLFSDQTEGLPVLDLTAEAAAWRNRSDANVDADVTPRHLAYVIYTSGSTGMPKGVLVEHRSISRLVLNNGYASFEESDRVALAANPAFDASTLELWAPLLNGGCIVVIAQEVLLNPSRFAAALQLHRVNVLWLTVGLFNQYAYLLGEQFALLRYLIVGGDALDVQTVSRVLRDSPPQQLINGYGPTETTTFASTYQIAIVPEGARSIPIGKPIANTRIYILDGGGEPVPVGVSGELYIGGAGVARGYLNRAELTSERFVTDPFTEEADGRMYRTGDLGRWLSDGNIEFLGRNDDQVKIRGFRIELGEIESRLLRHAGVREAVVIAREDSAGDKRLVAYYVEALREEGEALNAEQLRGYLSASLPEYMVPSAYVRLESLPLTSNGKLDRKSLPAPDVEAYAAPVYEAPQGEMEEQLASIWAEVLKVERVGRQDNFFSLGGHSLLAMRVVTRLRQLLHVEVAIREVFAHPVLSDLASALSSASRVELPPIGRAVRSGSLALSFAQQRLWFLAQLEGVSRAYHISGGLRLQGALDKGVLRRALDRIVERHEVLRTSFAFVEEEPVQRIGSVEESRFHLVEHDLGEVGDAERELRGLIAEEASGSFDLERGPLIRGRLVRLGDEDHVLWITMHHIISDGWSMGVLVKELSALYAAFLEGRQDPLPALEIQYADYAVWQRQWMEGEILQRQAEYWQRTLSGAPELLELPLDRPRPFQKDYAGASVPLVLDEELTAGLKALSRRHGTTLYMTLLAGWATLLSKLSGEPDVVIGTPTANRGRAEIEGLVGFFVNTLALRVDLSGSPSVRELLERVKSQALSAQQHQDIPFEQVVELLNPVRSLSHSPLFQVMFVWQNNEQGTAKLPGLELSPLPSSAQRVAKFDLTLSLQEAGERISGGIEYATSLFEAETIERYLGYFRSLLGAMVADEGQSVYRLRMLSERERDQVLYAWNATGTSYPSDRCVHELFEAQVAKTPEAVAVVFEDEQLSYGELNRRANQLAHYLRELGVVPDARVAICVERGFEMVVGLLAVLKAGGAYVPLDPAYPVDRLRFMLEDSGPVALLTQAHLAGLFSDQTEGLPILDLTAEAAAWRNRSDANVDADVTPRHLAYVIYTSGSTGMPKGVLVEHGGVVNRLTWMQQAYDLQPCEAVLQKTPFGFDVSVWEFFWTLIAGARLVMAQPEGHKDPGYLIATTLRNKITTMHFVPSMLQAFLEHPELADIPTLVRVVCSGEALPGALLQRFREKLPHAVLHNLYGPTEAAVDVTAWTCPVNFNQFVVPIGKPIANTRIYILDGGGEPVPVGVSGELYIGGVQVARGYLNRAELTSERFVTDPFTEEADARMYRTGDVGRWLSDGNIEFLGRNDDQVKIRGFRIELGEIESRLLRHAGVREAVVIAREDSAGDKRLVAYYVEALREEGEALNAEQLRGYLSASLPEYMVPSAYVRLESLPLTSNGKLDRKSLPAPDVEAYAAPVYEAPQGEMEEQLASIWAEVLKVERVGRQDNFFSLGGHSLLAVTLIERMRRSGLRVEVRALFATPTLAELAATAGAGVSEVSVPVNGIPLGSEAIDPGMLPLIELRAEEIGRIVARVPGGAANVQDIYPLAPLQEGILFHHLMGGEGDAYLVSVLAAVDTREQLDAFLRAMQWVVDRHDILRTAVLWEGLREPVQVVWRHARLQVEELELDPAAGDIAEQLYSRFDPRKYRIDVREAPLQRFYIAQDRENGRWIVVLLRHHLAGDHSTLEVMLGEVGAYLQGRQDMLPAPLPFRNLVAQARLGVSQEEHEVFFRQLLGDVDEATVPFGLKDVRGDGSGIEEAHLRLESALARRLRGSARRLGVSVASLCHLAWARVLAKVSGREDVVFGTVLFGRMQGGAGSDRAMGLFINTLPVRILVGDEGVEAAVRQTHALLAELMRHEHAPLALAQRCSAVPAPAPLFSALLNYRHTSGGAAAKTATSGTRPAPGGVRILRGAERTNYPFALSINDLGEGLSLDAQTPASIAPLRVCEYMRVALESLTEALEASPSRPVRTLAVLPERERDQVLYAWNATGTSYPSDRCVHELFEAQVAKTPEAVAVVFEDEQLSYGELNRRANQLAHYLRELGVVPDARVAICVERGFEMVVGLLAVLKAGGAYVPLDPAYPVDRLRFMLEDSGPVALLTQAHLAGLFSDQTEGLPVLDLTAEAAAWRNRSDANVDADVTPRHLAYVIYTSGSTGMPKGVAIQHTNAANFISWARNSFPFDSLRLTLFSTSLNFDLAVFEIFAPLTSGASLRIVQNALDQRFAIGDITLLNTVPSAATALLETGWNPRALNTINLAGEPLKDSLVEELFARTQIEAVCNLYGPSETTTYSTWVKIRRGESFRSHIGKPIANTRIYILDSSREPVPVGVTGELYIGGAGVARGYLNRAELTSERFVTDPFTEEADGRMYRTGDLSRWLPDGNIEFLGRNDFQVKIRGFRIELGEIESSLLRHAGVREAVVVAREDSAGDKRLVAYYVEALREEGEALNAEQLRGYLSASLPEYMVPSAYVRLKSLPLTSNGKLDRKSLPAPEAGAYAAPVYEAPQGEIEEQLASIWAEVLKVGRVGRQDNFFSLGGHSLLTIRVVTMLEQVGISILVTDLFAHPSIQSLAEYVGTKQTSVSGAAATDEVIPIRETGTQPPLFLIHTGTAGLLYIPILTRYIDVEIPVYGLPASETPLRTVEGMAARMVKMIRTVQPVGPYRVAGWSFGGTLAYEIATQLIGADQDVEFLGLLDTSYVLGLDEISQEAPTNYDEKEQILQFIESEIDADDERRLAIAPLRSSLATMDLETFLQKLKDSSLIPNEYSGHSIAQMRYSIARAHATIVASMSYSAWQIPIPVHLFAAQGSSQDNPTNGWSVVVPKNHLRVISVPGTHVSMMRSPHIETVGQSLTQAIRDAAASSISLLEKTYSPLFTLQDSLSNTMAPLICIPGAGDNITSFVGLSASLDVRFPIYGLQPRGSDGVLVPHSTVSAASDFYLRAVEKISPNLPIHLLGHSFGGWVAFDMARRLLESGRDVALVLLDSSVPDHHDAALREYSRIEIIVRMIALFEQVIGRSLDLNESQLASMSHSAQIAMLKDRLVEEKIIPERSEAEVLQAILRTFSAALRTNYEPKGIYSGPVHLLLADNIKLDRDANQRQHELIVAKWRRWAPNLIYKRVPGNHVTMLKPPHVSDLAQILNAII